MRLTGVALLLALVAAFAVQTARPAEAIEVITVAPGDDLGALIEAAEPGTRFLLQEGVHRGHSVAPKDNDEFIALPGAVMRGSIILDGFTEVDGVWTAEVEPFTPFLHGDCNEGIETCRYANHLFIEGIEQRLVLTDDELGPGAWTLHAEDGLVRIGADPADRLVELSMAPDAFHGDAEGVSILGLLIEQYGNPAQHGAIHGDDGRGWSVRDNEVRLNHGTGIRIGHEMTVTGNHIHRNGQLGIGGVGDDVVVANNELAWNNLAGFNAGWEGGGSKFVRTNGLVVRDNHVHHNLGTGLWTDIDNIGTLYERNLVEWNDSIGIRHEISYSATIRGNIVRHNGLGFDVWLWGAQIAVQNSSGVLVEANFVTVPADGGDGIAVLNQNRGDGVLGPWRSERVTVTGNSIRYLGSAGQSGVADDTDGRFACSAAAQNVFDGNRYTASADHSHWSWCGNDTWASFQANGQERAGSVAAVIEPVEGEEGTSAILLAGSIAGLLVASGGLVFLARRWGWVTW